MPRRRPGPVTAAAIMAIIYGSLFTFCNLCGLLSAASQGAMANPFGGADPKQAQMQKQIQDVLERDVPLYRVMQFTAPVVGLLGALGLLTAGVGLLRTASWARWLAVVVAALLILFNVLNAIYQIVFLVPAMTDVFDNVMRNAQAAGAPPMPPELLQIIRYSMVAGAVIGTVIQVAVIVYLLVIMFLLLGSRARAAFAGVDEPGADAGAPDRPEEEGWGGSAPAKRPEDDWRIQ